MKNNVRQRMAYDLKRASREHDAPIWRRLSVMIQKPHRARSVVNLNKISQYTKDGDVVVVQGKVLGMGTIQHSITLGSFAISETALTKIVQAGGRVASWDSIIRQYPAGTGVVLLG